MHWNLFSTCEIVSITAKFWFTIHLNDTLVFFYKWQLDGYRGGYFENIRQFPKLNKLSISIIVVNYNN